MKRWGWILVLSKMRKKLFYFGFLTIAFLFSLIFVGAYSYSTGAQYYTPRTTSAGYMASQGISLSSGFDENICKLGQDFVLQVSPLGCSPTVVRSDVLEEQNYPVFCSISATKVNPLIDVNAISSISFSGKYPESVAGIGYHPAKAALKTSKDTLLNSPVLENIGYVVIVLKQNKNESSMPDFVSGNLTATMNYDIENAFGIGQVTYYLPELSDDEWRNSYDQYSFWKGKGYLRATSIGTNNAVVSVYSDSDHRIRSQSINVGDSSQETFLPDFYCAAGLQTRLDGLVNPDSRARLNINGEISEVIEGETFLGGACRVTKVEKQGLLQRVDGTCSVDEGSGKFSLIMSPKVRITYNGVTKDYIVGDKVEGASVAERSVYVGYVGKGSRGTPYVIFVASPIGNANQFRSSSPMYKMLPRYVKSMKDPGSRGLSKIVTQNTLSTGIELTTFVAQGDFIMGVKCLGDKRNADCDQDRENDAFSWGNWGGIFGGGTPTQLLKGIKFEGFSSPTDTLISLSSGSDAGSYASAINDYRRIFTQFPNEKLGGDNYAGEVALRNGILLSKTLMQYKQMYELCNLFEGAYPDSEYNDVREACSDKIGMSNSEISTKTFFINGEVKRISFEGIYEPSPEDYSVQLSVFRDGQVVGGAPFFLTKNSAVLIKQNVEDTIFEYGLSGLQNPMYFQYNGNGWYAAKDTANLLSFSNLMGTSAVGLGGKLFLGGPTFIGFTLGANALKNYITNNGLPLGLASGLTEMSEKLSGKNFEEGKQILLTKGATALPPAPVSIELREIRDEENAVISLGFQQITTVSGATSSAFDRSLTKGVPLAAGNYNFVIDDINLKKVAKVTVVPNIKKTATSANFTFSVGIEKRAIQLSPTQIRNKIDDLENQIKKWESLSNNLGNVVEGFKGACLGIGAAMTVKNFFTNLGGESIARREVMTSAGGWNDICKKKVKDKEFSTLDSCLLANNDAIEKDVSLVSGIISSQSTINEKDLKAALPEIFSQLPANYQNDPTLKTVFTTNNYENCSSISVSQVRDLQRLSQVGSSSSVSPEMKLVAENNLKSVLDSVKASSERCARLFEVSSGLKIDQNHIGRLPTVTNNILGIPTVLNVQELPYYGDTFYNVKNQFSATSDIIADAAAKDNTPVAFYEDYSGNFLVILLKPNRLPGSYSVLERSKPSEDITVIPDSPNSVYVYDQDGKRVGVQSVHNTLKGLSFKKADRSMYSNPIINPEANYFETSPYKGLPAIVPFRTSEGWYVAVRQTIAAGGQIRAYDESGAASSYFICNVGSNKKIEFDSSAMDDICQGFNTGANLKYDFFYGLSENEINTLVKDAQGVLQQAGQQYPGKNNKITVRTSKGVEEIKVGNPALNNPEIQCQNFMSPRDCWIMFNACDPVVCPPTRCDLAGTYRVGNVIQSGIVGSTLLCLPNIREKIAVPVCLTGVKAGMDGIISLFQNYRDCLKTNLETGQTVGICDELHSIYLCEMVWRQVIPFAEIGIPTILEAVMGQGERGGGEYLSVQDAWNTADKSLQYLASYYGAGSYQSFKIKATEQVGSAICKNSISATYPSGGDLFDTLLGPDSPSQYYGYFDEIPMTTATIPPTSTYKVFYHIYAGKTEGAYYSVYLKSGEGDSYYQNNPILGVPDANGYIAAGKYASATREIVAPTGYKTLCINVNGKAECGFKKTTTDFAVNYLEEMYVASQADDRDITTEKDCVSGTNSLYSLGNLNVQEGVDNVINPEVYNHGLIRVCATDNPGKGTDAKWNNPQEQRWREVGYCDNQQIKCWLDSDSVKDTLKSTDLINQSLGEITNDQLKKIVEEGIASGTYVDVEKLKEQIGKMNDNEKIAFIDENLIDKAFWNVQKTYLLWTRAKAYDTLARNAFEEYLKSLPAPVDSSSPGPTTLASGMVGRCFTLDPASSSLVIPQPLTRGCTDSYDSLIDSAISSLGSDKNKDLDRSLVKALILKESGFNQYAVSPTGCVGLFQFCKSTATSSPSNLNVPSGCNNNCIKTKNGYDCNGKCTSYCDKVTVISQRGCNPDTDERFILDKTIPAGVRYLNYELNNAKTLSAALGRYCGISVGGCTQAHVDNIISSAETLRRNSGKCSSSVSITPSVIKDFGITGNVVNVPGSHCEACGSDGASCTKEICESIGKQLGSGCKFVTGSGESYKVGGDEGKDIKLDVNGNPLPADQQPGVITAEKKANDLAGYDFSASADGKIITLNPGEGCGEVIFQWDEGNRWYADISEGLTSTFLPARTSALRLGDLSSTNANYILGINSEAVDFGKELSKKSYRDFERGEIPSDLIKYKESVVIQNNGVKLEFTSRNPQVSKIDHLYFNWISESEGNPWVATIKGPLGSNSVPIFAINDLINLCDSVPVFAEKLKTKTPSDFVGGAGVITSGLSHIFEFQNGRALSGNLYYRFDSIKSIWVVGDGIKGPWFEVNNIPSSFSLGDKDKVFMDKIAQAKTYDEGLKLLVDRTLADDEGGWFASPSLVSGTVTFNKNVFDFSSDPFSISEETSLGAASPVWKFSYKRPSDRPSGTPNYETLPLNKLITNNFVLEGFVFNENQKALLTSLNSLDLYSGAKLIFDYGNSVSSPQQVNPPQSSTENQGTVYFFGDSLTKGLSDAMKSKISGATFGASTGIVSSRISDWSSDANNCQGSGSSCSFPSSYDDARKPVTVFVVLGTNGCSEIQGEKDILAIVNKIKTSGVQQCYWIGPMWTGSQGLCKKSSDSIKNALSSDSGKFCTFIDSTEFPDPINGISWDSEKIHPKDYSPWADFIASKLSLSTSSQTTTNLPASSTGAAVRENIINKYSAKIPTFWGEHGGGIVDSVNVGNQKIVFLTLDACGKGSGCGYDEALINYLTSKSIPVSIMMSGQWLDCPGNSEKFNQLKNNPLFSIQNHGYQHKACSANGKTQYDSVPSTNNVGELYDEIVNNQQRLQSLTGIAPKYYRDAGAYYDDVCLSIVNNDLGLKALGFDLTDTGTGNYAGTVKPGSIILMHMNHPEKQTGESAIKKIEELSSQGYAFGKLTDYLN